MQDPVIIITGAGKGIGKATFEELLKRSQQSLKPENAFKPRLMLVSRTLGDLKSIQEAGKKGGLHLEILEADVSDPSSAEKITSQCLAAFSRIDCLLNNAGVGRFGDFLELKAEDLEYVFKTNLTGTFLLTQSVFKQMSKQKSGHIVFVTSIAARKPFEQSSIYCMSKYGQLGLVEVLRLHAYKVGVRITNVLPGATYTPMWGDVDAEMKKKMMPVESVAQAIVDAICLRAPANLDEIVIRPMSGDL